VTVALISANTMQHGFGTSFSDSTNMIVTATGVDRCLFVPILYDNIAGLSVSGVTFGGQNCVASGSASVGNTGHEYAEVWLLYNPPTSPSAQTLVINISGGSPTDIYYNVISFQNVNQASPVRVGTYQNPTNQVTNGSGNFSLVISSNTSDLTFSAINGGSSGVNTTTQTSDSVNNTGSYGGGSDHGTTPASSVTHTWNLFGAAGQELAIVGFSINGDSNAAAPNWDYSRKSRLFLGRGSKHLEAVSTQGSVDVRDLQASFAIKSIPQKLGRFRFVLENVNRKSWAYVPPIVVPPTIVLTRTLMGVGF
jgi:hypothetical protein